MSSQEIERKFLVKTLPPHLRRYSHRLIAQGYVISDSRQGQVRVRRKGARHFLTIKRDGVKPGREETEMPISARQFKALWALTKGRRLTKTRYEIRWKKHLIELDVYRGRHRGLVVAEVEFRSAPAAARFEKPEWFGREITRAPRYKNSRLAMQPAKKRAS